MKIEQGMISHIMDNKSCDDVQKIGNFVSPKCVHHHIIIIHFI